MRLLYRGEKRRAQSPYTTRQYLQICKRVANGDEWPGIFNPRLVASEKWRDNLPEFVHLFELDTIQTVVEKAGFTIDGIGYFCYKNYPDEHRTDGNEFISLCATKSSIIDQEIRAFYINE